MADPFVLDMPVELGLELMTPVGANGLDAEWKLINYIIDEVDSAGLIVTPVDL
jgi:hypothetical protein